MLCTITQRRDGKHGGCKWRHLLRRWRQKGSCDLLLSTRARTLSDKTFSLAALHLINVTTDPDLPCVNPHAYTFAINADSRHKHTQNKAEWVERVWVKEIEISVVTAGQLRGSDKQPTVRQDGRPISLKQTLTDYLYTPADRKGRTFICERMSQWTHKSTIICMCSHVCASKRQLGWWGLL